MSELSILVVDDDPVMRKLLHERLVKADYDVTVAEDGFEAKKLIDQYRYDLVLTDLVMPGGIGGIEVLEIAKNKDPHIEVILITAHSSIDTAVEAMKKGAIDYLEKPINFDELFLRIEKILNLQKIMKNALHLHDAMGVKESAASDTIQNLEMTAAFLQKRLDCIENELRDNSRDSASRISKALDILAGFNE